MPPVFYCPVLTVVACDAGRIEVAVFARRRGKLDVRFSARELHSEKPMDWAGAVEKALSAWRPSLPRRAGVVLVLPASVTLAKSLHIPRARGRKRAAMLRNEAEQLLPLPLADLEWDTALLGGKTTEHHVLVAARTQVVEPLARAVTRAGFFLQASMPASLAVLAAARMMRDSDPDGVLGVSLDEGGASLAWQAGARAAIRGVSMSGLLGTDARSTARQRLAVEIKRTRLAWQRQGGVPVRGTLFVEDSNLRDTLQEYFGRDGGLKVECFPVDRCAEAGADRLPRERATVLLGAAANQLLPRGFPIDLTPRSLRRARAFAQSRRWLAAAALLGIITCVIPAARLYLLGIQVEEEIRQREVALAPVRASGIRRQRDLGRLEQMQAELAQWRSLERQRTVWLELFADLEARVGRADGIWLESVEVAEEASGKPRLKLRGRIGVEADRDDSVSAALLKLETLRAELRQSSFVAAVEHLHLARAGPEQSMRFDCLIAPAPGHPL